MPVDKLPPWKCGATVLEDRLTHIGVWKEFHRQRVHTLCNTHRCATHIDVLFVDQMNGSFPVQLVTKTLMADEVAAGIVQPPAEGAAEPPIVPVVQQTADPRRPPTTNAQRLRQAWSPTMDVQRDASPQPQAPPQLARALFENDEDLDLLGL
jgi:hypothetical protein